jgi:hypothetical protein
MTEFEVPKDIIYKGEKFCPFKRYDREPYYDDYWARLQWIFEKAYSESSFNLGIPFRQRFFKGLGFDQYQYFKGEPSCPENLGFEGSTWWHSPTLGKKPDPPYVEPFIIFFRNWIDAKAAPNSGYELESGGNPWLDRYLSDAPRQ